MAKKLLLLLLEHPDNWQQALTPIIDMSTAYRWLRRFIRQANTSLPAIRAALLELVPETCPSRPQSLAVRSPPALVTRFISLSQRLFQASVRLADTKQHQQAKVHQAKQLLRQAPAEPASPPFTAARFFKELATALKRNVEQFHATELEAMQQAWQQFGPFDPALVHIALSKDILDKKTDQHISFYLGYIIKTHINHPHKEQ